MVKEVACECVSEIARGLEAIFGSPSQALLQERVELFIDFGMRPDEAWHLRRGHCLDRFVIGFAEEEASPRQHLPEAHAKREEVCPLVRSLATCNLRREVAELPLHDTGIRSLELRARLGQAKVGDFHLAALADENVRRGYVSMH